ncbi:DUF2809 domain-containing protein [Zunongwangia sp. SCSIO 43204]|uniref:ribosomal maturation YjgA family protein n=1 Tax=Zunongwangia sp. SCSIO 43204 TaxID=2779359 RepID=UPI001CA80447|nr:DUF2809 domain-containing protein [Zunongwangia sp. SCSIO 43204]UAB85404.1 DUF2809 domain-containing protein [Zunongwangia sp. SCSIO 43204]
MRFSLKYFLAAFALFITEFLIARFIDGGFIRNVLGDYLVVFLIYYFLLSFYKWQKIKLAVFVLLVAYLIEILQYVQILKILGIPKSTFTDMILGSSFDWLDMLAYTLAFLSIVFMQRILQKKDASGKAVH